MESLTPNFFVNDIQTTISFYKELGFVVVNAVPEESTAVWVMLQCGKVSIMFQSFESLGTDLPQIPRTATCSMLLYIKVTSIGQLRTSLPANIHVVKDMEKTFYGATEFSILDNNGYLLTFAEDE